LLCEKNSDAERTNQSNIFTKNDIRGSGEKLDGISKEKIMPSIIGHLKNTESHCGERIILPESI
jgi:hypothetical protein